MAPEALRVRVVALAFIAALAAAIETWARDDGQGDPMALVDKALSVLGDGLELGT